MPIQRQLRSFWWFLEGRVGGMGRPGFNQCHWFELSFEEGLLLSWLGKQHGAIAILTDLWCYLDQHGPKAAMFYGLRPDAARARLNRLRDRHTLPHPNLWFPSKYLLEASRIRIASPNALRFRKIMAFDQLLPRQRRNEIHEFIDGDHVVSAEV